MRSIPLYRKHFKKLQYLKSSIIFFNSVKTGLSIYLKLNLNAKFIFCNKNWLPPYGLKQVLIKYNVGFYLLDLYHLQTIEKVN